VRRAVRILAWVAAGVVVLAAAAAGIAYWQARSLVDALHSGDKQLDVRRAQTQLRIVPHRRLVAGTPASVSGAQTILLIGSDRRWTAPKTANSDTIILARVDATHHRITLVSIPRDLYVAIPGHGHDRINEAFAHGGAGLLIATIREELGVKIDHFLEVNFSGFRRIVDTLGGVYLPIDQRYFNVNVHTAATNYASIDLQPGYQKLRGDQALAFARFRHTDNDFYRAARQQVFLRAVMRKLLTLPLNPLALRDRARAFAAATTSDIDSLGELWWLYRAVHGTSSQHLVRRTLQAHDIVLYGADYVQATVAEKRAAVRALYHLPGAHREHALAHIPVARHAPPRLVPDGGRGVALLRSRVPIRRCAPTALPPGYVWPATDAARSYTLAGHPAIAAWASAGSGRSILWMWTTWQDPPDLREPTATIHRGGRTYSAWTDSGRIRVIAWRDGPTRAWITNTLRNELTSQQMIALARTCAPLRFARR
jgi:LCP family protein required for cell wall assembly